MKLNIAILASGNGSNAENIISWCREHADQATVNLIITDREQAGVRQRAERLVIPCEVISFQGNKITHEEKIIESLRQYNINWLCLAGYMRLLSPTFLKNFYDEKRHHYRILNVHPALLPHFPGMGGYERIFAENLKESGVTVHLVDEGVDTGTILVQKKFSRKENDTLEDFKARGLQQEYLAYREALEKILKEGWI